MSDLSFRMEMRMAFAFGMPRKVTKPKADHHARMAEHWCQHARDLGRPDYWECNGFQMRGYPHSFRCGGEKAFGPFSRMHWKYIRLAMREAFRAEWHRALGTTYETTEGGRRQHAILTGLTA